MLTVWSKECAVILSKKKQPKVTSMAMSAASFTASSHVTDQTNTFTYTSASSTVDANHVSFEEENDCLHLSWSNSNSKLSRDVIVADTYDVIVNEIKFWMRLILWSPLVELVLRMMMIMNMTSSPAVGSGLALGSHYCSQSCWWMRMKIRLQFLLVQRLCELWSQIKIKKKKNK